MGVSENGGTPKSSILIGFSIRNSIHFGVPLFFGFPPISWQHFFPPTDWFPLAQSVHCWSTKARGLNLR